MKAINELAARIDAIQQEGKSKSKNKTATNDSPSRNLMEKGKTGGKEKCTCYMCNWVGHLVANCKLMA